VGHEFGLRRGWGINKKGEKGPPVLPATHSSSKKAHPLRGPDRLSKCKSDIKIQAGNKGNGR
jgi:hypothetical protein